MDTVFKTHTYQVDYIWGEEFYFIPFGDVHRDTKSCDVDRWHWFLNGCKKYPQEKCLYLAMGDLNDFASSREQDEIRKAKLHRDTRIKFDGIVQSDNRAMASEISFMRGHIIGLLDGNHNWVFDDGKTAVEDLAERINAPYLGWLTHITLIINIHTGTGKRRGSSTIRLYIVACHGKGGGKLMGTSVNNVDDLRKIFPAADIYIMGHDHQRYAVPSSVLLPSNIGGDVKQKRQFLARSGSFK